MGEKEAVKNLKVGLLCYRENERKIPAKCFGSVNVYPIRISTMVWARMWSCLVPDASETDIIKSLCGLPVFKTLWTIMESSILNTIITDIKVTYSHLLLLVWCLCPLWLLPGGQSLHVYLNMNVCDCRFRALNVLTCPLSLLSSEHVIITKVWSYPSKNASLCTLIQTHMAFIRMWMMARSNSSSVPNPIKHAEFN